MITVAEDPVVRPDNSDSTHSLGVGALDVQTVVVPEHGRWAVEIVVVFADGVVRHRIDTHPTEARARISASLIKRGAERDIRGPLYG